MLRSLCRQRAVMVEQIANEKGNSIKYDCRKLAFEIVGFELLQSRVANVIALDQMTDHSTTVKGANFVLYNVARLETILSTFDAQVDNGYYAKLPALSAIDFKLLKEEVIAIGFPMWLVSILTMFYRHVPAGGMANGVFVHRRISECVESMLGRHPKRPDCHSFAVHLFD